MKISWAGSWALLALLPLSLPAQSEKPAENTPRKPSTPEEIAKLPATDRAMQEYISRRAERLKEREGTLAQANAAKTEEERKQIMAKLDADERAFRQKNADLARRAHPPVPVNNVTLPPPSPAPVPAPSVAPAAPSSPTK